jgi:16S rRNA (uracil1498-N3)-methyltransferase
MLTVHARFHAPGAREPGQIIALAEDEAAHLTRVLRLKVGAPVRVFDGAGHEFEAVVEAMSKHGADVRLLAPFQATPEPRLRVTLAQAVLKGDKMDDVVRDAVMMGVSAIQPLLTARSEVSASALERGRRRERWQRIAVVSAKQCGRAVVPDVLEPVTFAALCSSRVAGARESALMLVEPVAAGPTATLADIQPPSGESVLVVVGPEGGWSPEEIGAAAGRMTLVTLRAPTLRADAMPVAALAALFARWGEW